MQKLTGISVAMLLGVAWWVASSLTEYRAIAFQTFPMDDYVPYIQFLASHGKQGELPNSPMRERIGSVAVVVPIFLTAPEVRFSLLPANSDPIRLRATLALVATNHLAFLLAAVIVSLSVFQGTKMYFTVAVVLSASAIYWTTTDIGGVDGIAIAIVALLLFCTVSDRLALGAILLLISPLFNEKIFIFAFPFYLVYSLHKRKWLVMSGVSLMAAGFYYFIRSEFGKGNEQQFDAAEMVESAIASIHANLSPRGLVLGLIPLIVVCGPMVGVVLLRSTLVKFGVAGLCAAVSLFTVALVGNAGNLTLGRISAYTIPISLYCLGYLVFYLGQKPDMRMTL